LGPLARDELTLRLEDAEVRLEAILPGFVLVAVAQED
jgi:hypothetical protein